MLRLCRVLLSTPSRDPFKVLGLTRSATKAEVKTKYRELARVYHPDGQNGDAQKMEEVNHAYKLLIKDGGFERLHMRKGAAETATGRPAGRPVRRTAPYSSEQHSSTTASGTSSSPTSDTESSEAQDGPTPLSDEQMEKVGALDPGTERRTPDGKFRYQNRDDGSWVELDRPLLRANQPRYASFAAKADMAAEMRRRAMELEKEQNEKSSFERLATKLENSSDLPTKNPTLLKVYIAFFCVVVYFGYKKTFARQEYYEHRNKFYVNLDDARDELYSHYRENKNGVDIAVVTAAIVFLAAAEKKVAQDPIQPPREEVFFRAAKPPSSNFHVYSGF